MWQKSGLVWAPSGHREWARTHAYLPTPCVIDGRLTVYFSGLDDDQVGRIGRLELAVTDPTRVVSVEDVPVLDLGEPGCFDDAGVNPCSVVKVGNELYLYYIGWQRHRRIPYTIFCGLAISRDNGGHFERVQRVPVLERTSDEPWVRSAMSVILENDMFRGWYVAGSSWTTIGGRSYPQYVIRHAESPDGRQWRNTPGACITSLGDDEFGFGRPWVVHDSGRYRMWYSIRSRTSPYRLGYAESIDGLSWTRLDDKVGIERSAQGWDSEMICFGATVDVADTRYMLHNGNRHGATGFGLATWRSPDAR